MPILYAIAGILAILGQLGDCLTTQIALAHGGREMNPLMIWITGHAWMHYSVKIGLPLLYLVMCQKRQGSKKAETASLLVIAIAGFGAALWNLSVIRHLLR